MVKFINISKPIVLLSVSILLSGCLGGTVAQQVARSIATSMADSAVANAMDVQELEQQDRYALHKKTLVAENTVPTQNSISQHNAGLQAHSDFQQNSTSQQNLVLQNAAVLNTFKNTPPDPYQLAFVSARFEELKPTLEPLPEQLAEIDTAIAAPIVMLQNNQPAKNQLVQNRLVQVELFNLLIGEEKAAVYTKAQLLGATFLPKQREWKLWRVATGVIKNNAINTTAKNSGEKTHATKSTNTNAALNDLTDSQQVITFLIPPELGRLPSGGVALVEIASPGELNIARYKIN